MHAAPHAPSLTNRGIYSYLGEHARSSRIPCVCATLRMATRAVARVYDQALASHGLRTTQFSILARLDAEGPASVGDSPPASRWTGRRSPARPRRSCAPARRGGEEDRRRVLALSPKGLTSLETARPAWRAAQRRVRDELGYERTQGLLGELRALLGAVRA